MLLKPDDMGDPSHRLNKPLSAEARKLLEAYQTSLYGLLALTWLALGIPCLWMLRVEIGRLLDYFTWAAIRYTLFYKPTIASLGFLACVAVSTFILLSQSRLEVVGPLPAEKELLERWVQRIGQFNSTHPVYRWLFRERLSMAQLPKPDPSQD